MPSFPCKKITTKYGTEKIISSSAIWTPIISRKITPLHSCARLSGGAGEISRHARLTLLYSPVTNKIILGEQDGITVLLKTMQRYSNNPIVMEAAVTALRNVSNKCSKLFLRAASDYRASRLQLRRSNLATCGYLWVSLVTYAWLSMLRLVINTTLGYGITAGLSGEIKTLCSLS